MPYVSFMFFMFVALTLFIYYITPIKIRQYILLLANFIFYIYSGWKNTVFLILVIILSYSVGIMIDKYRKYSKLILVGYILLCVTAIFFIKFANYILQLSSNIFNQKKLTLSLIVPLGVSFFVLQAIGYVIDVYRKKYYREKNFFKFTLFMSFFPIIVQGPISRYDQLAGQLFTGHRFCYKNFKFGLQLALWGLYKKLVVANRAGIFVDTIFSDYHSYSGVSIVFAVLLYTIQIYTDFSGCVDLCRGISEMFGVKLMENFDHPYFAISINDFWRRWHISLSSWFRDYIYIPLGGNRKGNRRKYLNLICVFFISGMWHGVGIHYLAWGLFHGIAQILSEYIRKPKEKLLKIMKVNTEVFSYKLGRQIVTLILISYSWLLFRADGFVASMRMTYSIFMNFHGYEQLNSFFFQSQDFWVLIFAVIIIFIVSTLQEKIHIRTKLSEQNLWFRWSTYIIIFFVIIIFGVYGKEYNASDFLYMQF